MLCGIFFYTEIDLIAPQRTTMCIQNAEEWFYRRTHRCSVHGAPFSFYRRNPNNVIIPLHDHENYDFNVLNGIIKWAEDWWISANKIGLIVYDFDGVMTDNKVILSEDGKESVIVSRADGLSVSIINKMGI